MCGHTKKLNHFIFYLLWDRGLNNNNLELNTIITSVTMFMEWHLMIINIITFLIYWKNWQFTLFFTFRLFLSVCVTLHLYNNWKNQVILGWTWGVVYAHADWKLRKIPASLYDVIEIIGLATYQIHENSIWHVLSYLVGKWTTCVHFTFPNLPATRLFKK